MLLFCCLLLYDEKISSCVSVAMIQIVLDLCFVQKKLSVNTYTYIALDIYGIKNIEEEAFSFSILLSFLKTTSLFIYLYK